MEGGLSCSLTTGLPSTEDQELLGEVNVTEVRALRQRESKMLKELLEVFKRASDMEEGRALQSVG